MKPAIGFLFVFMLGAANGLSQPAVPTAPVPPMPNAGAVPSPTEIFRQLLAMNNTQRGEFLASKPAPQRQRVEAKIDEYLKLAPEEREARLQALEIRWHMLQLMNLPPTNRTDRLTAVPEQYRTMVRQRLNLWDILPPPLKKDVLDNEIVIRLFLQLQATQRTPEELLAELPPERREQLQRDFERWRQLPTNRREQMCANFDRFFGLDRDDRSRTLDRLPESERVQMQATLVVFEKLPAEERERVVEGFKKFKSLAPAERQEFLKSAERWQAMSDKDRALWRQVITRMHAAKVAPPPLPPGPSASLPPDSFFATNR